MYIHVCMGTYYVHNGGNPSRKNDLNLLELKIKLLCELPYASWELGLGLLKIVS